MIALKAQGAVHFRHSWRRLGVVFAFHTPINLSMSSIRSESSASAIAYAIKIDGFLECIRFSCNFTCFVSSIRVHYHPSSSRCTGRAESRQPGAGQEVKLQS
jgi:hypothetical protein